MNEDLQDEVEAINSIYGNDTLVATSDHNVYILNLPQQAASLRLHFPLEYPAAPPVVLGTQSSGEHTRKGDAANTLDSFRRILGKIYQPGEVCLFDVIEEVNNSLSNTNDALSTTNKNELLPSQPATTADLEIESRIYSETDHPLWTLSDVVVELKSVFIARCVAVSSPDQAKHYLQHLLDSDKRIRSATHNITAWRIRGDRDITFQDCDDDGETAAGGRVLHLMQLMDLWNVMVVVTRWYGGHQLGPKRFSIINNVARDAFVKGDFVEDEALSKKKIKR
jgi:hypothetical protein